MEAPPMQSETATNSRSSPGPGNLNAPEDNSQKTDAPPEEDSKLKGTEEEANIVIDIDMLTIADSSLEKVPHHLERLLGSIETSNSTQADLLIAIIYGVSLECSFAAVNVVQKLELVESLQNFNASGYHSKFVRTLSEMPSDIYDANKMTYNIRMQLYFQKTETTCLLTGIVTGDLLLVTLTPDCASGKGRSLCLSIARYVLNAKGRPFPSRFRKLPELSYKLREQVLMPVRKEMINTKGVAILYPSLDGLPEELHLYLYRFLNKNALNKMANVSTRFYVSVMNYKKNLIKKLSFVH